MEGDIARRQLNHLFAFASMAASTTSIQISSCSFEEQQFITTSDFIVRQMVTSDGPRR